MNQNVTQPDNILLSEIKKDNLNAFDILFKKYYTGLCAFAMQYVGREDAEEVVQDSMVWLWENREYLEIDMALKPYLFSMIKNKSLTLIARNKVKERVHFLIVEKLRLNTDYTDFYIIEELSNKIEKAISDLPDSYREALEMNRFQGKTYKEIAETLNISSKTVDYRIQKALKFLKVKLKDYLPLMVVFY